jgi:hypothetical protein
MKKKPTVAITNMLGPRVFAKTRPEIQILQQYPGNKTITSGG